MTDISLKKTKIEDLRVLSQTKKRTLGSSITQKEDPRSTSKRPNCKQVMALDKVYKTCKTEGFYKTLNWALSATIFRNIETCEK
jgi:hypothetical protein